jgi:hypothetical protein
MISMKSMELDDEDKLDVAMPIAMPDRPDYPYGLRITLTDKEIEKLGVDPKEACAGGIFHMHALARVTSVNLEQRDGKDSCRIEAQIEDMSVESEGEENE